MMRNQATYPQAMRTAEHQKQEKWIATMVSCFFTLTTKQFINDRVFITYWFLIDFLF